MSLADLNECETNNGGCDKKRTCTNTAGSRTCEDCASGWTNEGDTQCKGMCAIANVLLARYYIAMMPKIYLNGTCRRERVREK